MVPNAARGLAGTVATIKGEPITPNALTIVGDTLLPTAVREAVARRRPKAIVIVPDGALHQLPFEALLLTAGPEAKYVLDEWPALTYAPSATVLARLTDRLPPDAAGELRLLLVGHSGKKEEKRVGAVGADASRRTRESSDRSLATSATGGVTRSGARFDAAPLPGVTSECRRIESLWPKRVTALLDDEATEARVTAQMPSHRLLHLATHGFVDERADNLFGGLLLSADANGSDDGYLSYLDILRSDLTGCELAVLSACQTSIGPERPMEASTSLAQAFLAAGSRQVVASLWQVSDESTSELMADFYRRLAEDVSANRPLRVAAALHAAKRQLRQQAAWNSPAHWASFIYVGPAK
jgi:CHAT domain-containing protein